jgi:hypothetical protein
MPVDVNQLAHSIVARATGQRERLASLPGGKKVKNKAAVELGRRGGLKGGKARADKLSAKRRRAIAKKAAAARWAKKQASG